MMDIGNTTHGHEGSVVQCPSDDRIKSGVMDLVNVGLLQVIVTALPAHRVPCDYKTEDTKTGSATPVNEGVAEEEVLDDCKVLAHFESRLKGSKLTIIVPSTHTKTNMEKRPLPERGGEIVLLVRIGYKRIVGGHHGNVEMDEVLEEGRLVVPRVTSWKLVVDMALDVPVSVHIARVV